MSAERVQHPPHCVTGQSVINTPVANPLWSRERGRIAGVECHIGREGLGRRGTYPMLVLVMNLAQWSSFQNTSIAATISVVVHLVDPALIPRVVSISVGSVDPTHIGGGAKLHWIGKRAVAHLDERREAIDVWHDQIVALVAVHVPSDVYMGDFAAARRVIEVASRRPLTRVRSPIRDRTSLADRTRTRSTGRVRQCWPHRRNNTSGRSVASSPRHPSAAVEPVYL